MLVFILTIIIQFMLTPAEKCECGVSGGGLSTRIVGGTDVEPHAFPWMVAIFIDDLLHCGGALISNLHVLSAGHCFKWEDKDNMYVSLGLHELKDRHAVTRKIAEVTIHEDFNSTNLRDENDIAILTLDEPVTFSDRISPVCIPDGETNYGGKRGTIAGWGKVGISLRGAKTLNKAKLWVLKPEICRGSKLAKYLTDSMMCAYAKEKDGCQGDSGGPLLFESPPGKFFQIGIVSWGIGCANPRYPGVYTNVSQYTDWIHMNTLNGITCAN